MSRKFTFLLGTILLISMGTNAYLFSEAKKWKAAWVSQFATTREIEDILKASGADISIEGIKKSAEARFGSIQAVEVGEDQIQFGSDGKGLKVSNTLLLFKDGVYHGSKADLP
jgi:hypothetical protein